MNPPNDDPELDDSPSLFTLASGIYAFAMTVLEVSLLLSFNSFPTGIEV